MSRRVGVCGTAQAVRATQLALAELQSRRAPESLAPGNAVDPGSVKGGVKKGFEIVLVLTGAAVLSLTGGGALEHQGEVKIQDAHVRDGGRTLEVGVDRCHGQPYTWRAAENRASVTVTIIGSGRQGSPREACSDLVQVPLTRTLDGGRVFDLSSGHSVQVPGG